MKKNNRLKELGNEIEKDLEEIKGPSFEIETIKENSKKSNKIFIFLSFILIIICITSFVFIKVITPSIKLIGDKEIKLMINSEYVDSKASAKYLNKDVSDNIKTSGTVNTKKVGSYTITYSIKKGFQTKKIKRLVTVVDDGPLITLEGGVETSICPDSKYEEIGFKAVDNKENDLTDKVVTSNGQDMITYSVKDSNNTLFTITRKLIREDKEAPEIKLNGNSHVYVTIGNVYTDGGAIATDKCDGDLTEKIEKSGSVDTNKLGDYEIVYKVKDKAGNEATLKRTVTVQQQLVKRSANLGCGKPGVIYLTFDDGPNNSTTTQILNVLKKYDVKATFFVASINGGSDSQIKREFDEGHLIALHTWSHEYSDIYRSEEAYFNDLNKISDRVEKITGKKSMFVRFPGGSSNTVSRHYSTGIMSKLASSVEAKGYSYFDWNLDSTDAGCGNNCTADVVYSHVVNGLSKSHGNVVLMHDIKKHTANALERIIQYGKNNGYTFDVLDSSIICHHKVAN